MTAFRKMEKGNNNYWARLFPLTVYMVIFFLIPVGVFFVYSFWGVYQWDIVREWTLKNYVEIFTSWVYTELMLRSIVIGLITAVLAVVIVYPLAYTMVFRFEKYRDLILFLLAISLFSNYLIRIYSWRAVLSANGLVNYILLQMGLADGPQHYLLYSQWGVILVLLNVYIPYATLPIYSALLNVDRDIIHAANDLGASPLRAFREITLPLSMPGVYVAFLFIFLLSAGDFVTPEMIGGKTGMMIGNAVATQFGVVSNWPLGSAMVFTMILMMITLILSIVVFGSVYKKVKAAVKA